MMSEKTPSMKRPSSGFTRWMFRAPIWLYRIGLGGLMTGRMVLLNHVGRKSGKMRQTVVEVARYDKATDTVYVASGWGVKSDWYRNLLANSEIAIQVGWRKMAVTAVPLTPEQSGEAMVDYAHRYSSAAKVLSNRLLGFEVDGTDEGYYALGHDAVPFMALKPRS
jgi:deazaflavin-dependent oxidoreductase (nitroreductase family)